MREHLYVASDFDTEVRELLDPATRRAREHIIQLPYAKKERPMLTEEEQTLLKQQQLGASVAL